jgi:hypothetical protein
MGTSSTLDTFTTANKDRPFASSSTAHTKVLSHEHASLPSRASLSHLISASMLADPVAMVATAQPVAVHSLLQVILVVATALLWVARCRRVWVARCRPAWVVVQCLQQAVEGPCVPCRQLAAVDQIAVLLEATVP